MIEQAGVYKIVLYENKGLEVQYRPDGSIKAVLNTGETISLENCDDDTLEIGLEVEQKRSDNNKSLYKYIINWKLLGLSNENLDKINLLRSSIYKWVAFVQFYNKSETLILNLLIFDNSSIDNNISNHYNISLFNVVYGEKSQKFNDELGYIFEDEAEYIFEDDVEYIFE